MTYIFVSVYFLPCRHTARGVCLISAGLPPVLSAILRLLRQGEKNWQRRVPTAARLLPGWDGCLCLQFHHSVEKVIPETTNTYECVEHVTQKLFFFIGWQRIPA